MRTMRIRGAPPAITAVLVLALAAAGCSSAAPRTSADRGTRPQPATSPKAAETERAEDASDAPVPDVLDFAAPAVGGGRVAGREFAGRDVAMWFWAPT
jgi:hypothetical protein